MNYYTFRKVNGAIVEATKWEYDRSHPLETYEIELQKSCNCPARVICKHIKAVREGFATGKDKEWHMWRWDGQWHRNTEFAEPFWGFL